MMGELNCESRGKHLSYTAANLQRSRAESKSHLAVYIIRRSYAIFILVLLCLLTTANTHAAIKSKYQL